MTMRPLIWTALILLTACEDRGKPPETGRSATASAQSAAAPRTSTSTSTKVAPRQQILCEDGYYCTGMPGKATCTPAPPMPPGKKVGAECGGVAGFMCEPGALCVIMEQHPDAMGVCKARDVKEGEACDTEHDLCAKGLHCVGKACAKDERPRVKAGEACVN